MTPTVGRIVHFREKPGADVQAAIVAKVWSDDMVNLAVISPSGTVDSRTSVARVDSPSFGGAAGWEWPLRVEP